MRTVSTIALLWRHERPLPPRPGRPPTITVDRIVDAGIAEADAEGLSGLSLRGVAQRLGVGTMTLYGHVEGRAQLLELMVDQCRRRMAFRPPTGDPRRMLEQVAAENRTLLAQHPWLAAVETERAVLGPGTLGKYERELAAVEPLPLSDVDKDQALALVLGFVAYSARAAASARAERAQEPPDQWWRREGAELAKLGVAERFPLGDRIGSAVGAASGAAAGADAAYVFGLAVILDGVESRAMRAE
ncbi:TetR/AcrR family transcriptional regulator [Tomitella gaofuii]|uniref:TetR/AcrR family transcriptional regulator n=1 Tax=Tomitella gaofuii TaxID=2760083 RepID=UPI002E2B8C35|nr:TetR/AcrR family transcriptional regulator C-terminal domain-containing protein [Tomitella gaofuii]